MEHNIGIISNQEIGCKLARILGERGYTVSLFPDGVEFQDEEEQSRFCIQYQSPMISVMLDLESLLMSIESPRRIFLVGNHTEYADEQLKHLLSHLEAGDILVDLCDAKFTQVLPRVELVRERGASYLSVGMLMGDSSIFEGITMLPGGAFPAYDAIRNILISLSAKMDGDFYCCPYIGPDGSGQYVKMVHDALSDTILAIYAEAISFIRTVLQCDAVELAEILSQWNSGECGSYLLDVICAVVRKYDEETGNSMLDVVLDSYMCQPGTRWTVESAIALNVPVPTIYASFETCAFSHMKNERMASSKMLKSVSVHGIGPTARKGFLLGIQHAVYLATLSAFSQGFALLKKASDHYAWELNLLSIAKAYQGSSNIRSEAMFRVIDALERKSNLNNLLLDPYFKSMADAYAMELRNVSKRSISIGLPSSCLCGTIQYLDSYRAPVLASGVNALVWDYMTGEGFERNDRAGIFRGVWTSPDNTLRYDVE